MTDSTTFECGSFRDRSGRIFHRNGQVFRALGADGFKDWTAIAEKAFVQSAMTSGSLVQTERVSTVAVPKSQLDSAAVLKHETVQAGGFHEIQRLQSRHDHQQCAGSAADRGTPDLEA